MWTRRWRSRAGPVMLKVRREDRASLPELPCFRHGLVLRRHESGEACGVDHQIRNRAHRILWFDLLMCMAKQSSRLCPRAIPGRRERSSPIPSVRGDIQWSTEDVALKPSNPDAIAARCGQDPGVAESSRNAGPGDLRPTGLVPKSRKRQERHDNHQLSIAQDSIVPTARPNHLSWLRSWASIA